MSKFSAINYQKNLFLQFCFHLLHQNPHHLLLHPHPHPEGSFKFKIKFPLIVQSSFSTYFLIDWTHLIHYIVDFVGNGRFSNWALWRKVDPGLSSGPHPFHKADILWRCRLWQLRCCRTGINKTSQYYNITNQLGLGTAWDKNLMHYL